MPDNTIEIHGLDRLQAAFEKFPQRVVRNLTQAAHESATDHILPTVGLQHYPPETAANRPPTPYYIRGTGTQTSAWHNTLKSQNLGKQWHVRRFGVGAKIGNRASYSEHVHGEKQAGHMAKIGWRKLFEVAKEKVPAIQKVYNNWVAKTLRDLGI